MSVYVYRHDELAHYGLVSVLARTEYVSVAAAPWWPPLVSALLGALIGTVVTNLFVSRQIVQEKRIEMAATAFQAYLTAVSDDPKKRLPAIPQIAAFADKDVVSSLGTFEEGIGQYDGEIPYLFTRDGMILFRELIVSMRNQLGSAKVSTGALDLVLYRDRTNLIQ